MLITLSALEIIIHLDNGMLWGIMECPVSQRLLYIHKKLTQHSLALMILPGQVIKCLHANNQAQGSPKTSQFSPESYMFSYTVI